MIGFLITLAIVVVVLIAAWYLLRMLPPQFQPYVTVLFVVIAVILCIWLLLQLPGLIHSIPHVGR
jgi:hypothetical protein